jgi:hypothetical protein
VGKKVERIYFSGNYDQPRNTDGVIVANVHGKNYNIMLEHTEKIFLWGYFGIDVFPQNAFRT